MAVGVTGGVLSSWRSWAVGSSNTALMARSSVRIGVIAVAIAYWISSCVVAGEWWVVAVGTNGAASAWSEVGGGCGWC